MPSNIALCKYWGKRDSLLNLPISNSLSISLGDKGTTTTISLAEGLQDEIILNGINVHDESNVRDGRNVPAAPFFKKTVHFLDHFRGPAQLRFRVDTKTNLPVAAGLASSASGFAALVCALDIFFDWRLSQKELSILARLGSGSACRSLWQGFVEWEKGNCIDGSDSFGVHLPVEWKEFRVGLLIGNRSIKKIGSREAMDITKKTSPFYELWPKKAEQDVQLLKEALFLKDFVKLGEISEANALCMHALMQTANPPIVYSEAQTIAWMHQIWQARKDGLMVYFTQDAGPNLKLLFLEKDISAVKALFSEVEIVDPFNAVQSSVQSLVQSSESLIPEGVISESVTTESVILVNEADEPVGLEEKITAHRKGLLHRAFSVFVYKIENGIKSILLQKRHPTKYHCGGLWSNTCCSHPRQNEDTLFAASRRLKEEMGLDLPLKWVGAFRYQAQFSNGLIEHEYDHVFVGKLDADVDLSDIQYDKTEISDCRWITIDQLQQELQEEDRKHIPSYTPWLKPALDIIVNALSRADRVVSNECDIPNGTRCHPERSARDLLNNSKIPR